MRVCAHAIMPTGDAGIVVVGVVRAWPFASGVFAVYRMFFSVSCSREPLSQTIGRTAPPRRRLHFRNVRECNSVWPDPTL